MTGMTRARDGPAADRLLGQQGITSNMALKQRGCSAHALPLDHCIRTQLQHSTAISTFEPPPSLTNTRLCGLINIAGCASVLLGLPNHSTAAGRQDGRTAGPSLYKYANPGSYELLARPDGRLGSEAIFFHASLVGPSE
jgi:hypothetical protein